MRKWNTSQQHAQEREQNVKRHDSVCAQLHFSIFKETGVNLDNKHSHDLVPNQLKQDIKGRLSYYGTY
jgi:hypothetical protein